MIFRSAKLPAWAGPVLLVATGLAVNLFNGVPFAPAFNAGIYVAVVGLILTFTVPGIMLLKSPAKTKKCCGALLTLCAYVLMVAAVVGSIYGTIATVLDLPLDTTSIPRFLQPIAKWWFHAILATC